MPLARSCQGACRDEYRRAAQGSGGSRAWDLGGSYGRCGGGGDGGGGGGGGAGGIIASEMGMGKTLMAVALALRNGLRSTGPNIKLELANGMLHGGTLIVAPPVLDLTSWENEPGQQHRDSFHRAIPSTKPETDVQVDDRYIRYPLCQSPWLA